MPRRWGINTRLWAYRYLCLRDGELCARCFNIPTAQNTLDIDHIDGNPQNYEESNLRLLCRRCNVTLENQARVTRVPSSDQKEREKAEGNPRTRVIREVINYRLGSQEMQANFLYELDFRNWLLGKIKELGGYPKGDAISAGAEVVGCSPTTTTKYLAKLTSSAGPLKESKDMLGDIYLELKDHLKPEPSIFVDLDTRTNVLKSKGNDGKKKLDPVPGPRGAGARLPLPQS